VRKTTKLIEGGHRGFQDYRHTSTFFTFFTFFLKIQKVVTFYTFFAEFRSFSRTMLSKLYDNLTQLVSSHCPGPISFILVTVIIIIETDRKRVDAFLNRYKKCGFCSPELQTFIDMVDEADQRLFCNIRYNTHHVLHELLLPISVASQNYELRTRAHNRAGSLSDSNFITRMIYNTVTFTD